MKKLLNPFALVAQGFVMGALIFFAAGGLDQSEVASASMTAPVEAQQI